MTLDRILVDFKFSGLSEDEKGTLNRAWHRLTPWPDGTQRSRAPARRLTVSGERTA
jgi:hypothetical protein